MYLNWAAQPGQLKDLFILDINDIFIETYDNHFDKAFFKLRALFDNSALPLFVIFTRYIVIEN